jgi:thiol-disulfide isomerase/thioredoxin
VEVSSPSPANSLLLPIIDTTGAQFYNLFYTRSVGGNDDVDIMALPTEKGQQLFIDYNRNRDLRDDGPSALFPYSQNAFRFELKAPNDPRQLTHFLIERKPDMPDSSVVHLIDSDGNLSDRMTRLWAGASSNLAFSGKQGTFFFGRRLNLRRGSFTVGFTMHEIGLFDYDNDGLFNGKNDALLIDFVRPGKLEYYTCSFAFDDVFQIDSLRLTIGKVDPYGNWVELVVTSRPLTPFLPARAESVSQESPAQGIIDGAIWGIQSCSIDGDTVSLAQLRGKNLLLNFWGEWCKPCLDEIPTLVEGNVKFSGKGFTIIGFLKSYDLKRAKEIIRRNGMTWPQLILNDTLISLFRIRGYPTNILIRPNGQYFLQVGTMQKSFLDSLVQ